MLSLLFRAEPYSFSYFKLNSLCVSLSFHDSKLRKKHVRHNVGRIPDGNPNVFPQSVYKFILVTIATSLSVILLALLPSLRLPYNQVLLPLFRSQNFITSCSCLAIYSLAFHQGQLVLGPQTLFVYKHFKYTEFNKDTCRQQFPHTNLLSSILF